MRSARGDDENRRDRSPYFSNRSLQAMQDRESKRGRTLAGSPSPGEGITNGEPHGGRSPPRGVRKRHSTRDDRKSRGLRPWRLRSVGRWAPKMGSSVLMYSGL